MELFSPAQCVGYVAFFLGVTAFLQKKDRPLKLFIAAECLVYAVHFSLLINFAAAASAFISSVRSFLAMKTRSPLVAIVIIAVNLAAGVVLAKSGVGWIPVIGSCVSTYAVFTMQGIPMRLALLTSTFCWLANNIICGSIGGTLLEAVIAIVNISTIVRLFKSSTQNAPEELAEQT